MKVNINSNFNLGGSFTEYVEKKCENNILKFFESVVNVNVFVSKEGRMFVVKLTVNDGIKRGVLVKASDESDNIYYSFDSALIKIMKQLRKNKSKIIDYKRKMSSLKAQNSDLPYIMADRQILKEQLEDEKESVKLDIIDTKETEIEELTVDEAVMKMELINIPAYMFLNKDNNEINVVYRRPDGNITWIVPKRK